MPKCKNCGKWGLFLKLSNNGLCEDCEMAIAIQNRNNNQNARPILHTSVSSSYSSSRSSNTKKCSDSTILSLLRKFTTESEEDFLVTNLHYVPLNSAHIPQDQIHRRLESLVMNKLYKMSSNKTWIRDSVKPDIFFSNYEELMYVLSDLIEFECCFPFYKPIPSEIKQEYTLSRSKLTDDFIYRWWDSVLNQTSGLKTVKGKQNKIEKSKEQLLRYKKYLSDANINLINQLTSTVIDLENLSKKEKDVIPFDVAGEAQITDQLKLNCGVMERHFILIQAQDFYYKYRSTDKKYLEKCIDLCVEDINLLDKLNSEYKISEKDTIYRLSRYSNGLSETDKFRLQDIEEHGFRGDIPAWKRLCIIYEKDNQFDKALEYCEKSITYYTAHGMTMTADDFKKRKERLKLKISKKTAVNSKSSNAIDITPVLSETISSKLQSRLGGLQLDVSNVCNNLQNAECTNNGKRYRIRWDESNPRFVVTEYYDNTYQMHFCHNIDEVVKIIQ